MNDKLTHDIQGNIVKPTDWTTEVTNVCTCETDWCDADCWNDVTYFVGMELGDLWEEGATWYVDGLPLWNRDVSGSFRADTIDDFIRGITVKDVWTLRLRREGDIVNAMLSHHDVPTGRSFTITKKD